MPTAELDTPSILRAHLSATTELFAEQRTSDQVRDAMDGVSGGERRTLRLHLALALADEMAAAEPRDRRRMRREHDRILRALGRVRADDFASDVAFVEMWSAWRNGRANADRLAERYTTRHRESGGELIYVAWLIRGEIDAEADEWEDAADDYRYLLGALDHPLYPFALLRTAHSQRERGQGEEARATLTEVVALSCREMSEQAEMVVRVAAAEIDARLVDGRSPDCGTEAAPRGEDERPPGFQ